MKIALYTAIFGDYNPLREIPPQTLPVDCICFTDNNSIDDSIGNTKCNSIHTPGWKVIKTDYPRYDLHPRMRAKYFKIQAHCIRELQDFDVTIYIDGSIRVTHPGFVQWCLDNLQSDMLVFKHPQRQCIYDEYTASIGLRKYEGENMSAQVNRYREFYPAGSGLYALGVLVRKNSETIKRVMNDWWNENICYSYQDQLSFPVVCYLHHFVPSTFGESQYNNPYFEVLWHDDVRTDGITILMPVYRTPLPHLSLAVDSILNQTFRDFQFLIVDDNNDDPEIIAYLQSLVERDTRVTVVRMSENKGLAAALDFGLQNAANNLIVRMDSDDIAWPQLLERQYAYFRDNPHVACCGVQVQAFENGDWRSHHPATITRQYVVNNTEHWFVNHPGVAFRRDVVVAVGGYGNIPPGFAEDYALWVKLLQNGYTIHNQQDVLINYRLKPNYHFPEGYNEFLEEVRKSLLKN